MNVAKASERPGLLKRLSMLPVVATAVTACAAGQSPSFVTGPDACGPWEDYPNLTVEIVKEQGVQVPETPHGVVVVKFGKLATAMAVVVVDKDGKAMRIAPLWWQDVESSSYTLAMSPEAGSWVVGVVLGFGEQPDQVMPTTVTTITESDRPLLTC